MQQTTAHDVSQREVTTVRKGNYLIITTENGTLAYQEAIKTIFEKAAAYIIS